MEMSEMLDVLHFFMEEELAEDVDTVGVRRSRLRQHMYDTLYERQYKYYITPVEPKKEPDEFEDWGTPITPYDPSDPTKEVKPFIPSTPMNANSPKPFGNVLDAPLN